LAVVGLEEVLQAMPDTVIVAPPLETMVPPLEALVWVTPVTALVVTVGRVKAAHLLLFHPLPEAQEVVTVA
jgi:hypothetical protein